MDKINWQPSSNSISDLLDWTDNSRLELRPSFQRKSVWGEAAKIMLMDTILKNIPMPKIFVSNLVKNNKPYRSIIDGQQRVNAILAFIRDEFTLKKPYDGELQNKKFSELPVGVRNDFLRYKLDFNEINDASDDQLREIYSRVNKYSTVLNKQELRHSDFPGDFLDLSLDLATQPFFEGAKVFTLTNRRRLLDVEFVSELLVGLIAGAQDKKITLDDFYQNYAQWNVEEKGKIKLEFIAILKDIDLIFDGKEYHGETGPKTAYYHEKLELKGFISKTRFKQKADFYALFLAIAELKRKGFSIQDKNLDNLRMDLFFMHKYTEPHSEIELFREYATKCLSDANSIGSRKWRVQFLFNILEGTYTNKITDIMNITFSKVALDWVGIKPSLEGPMGCPVSLFCGVCNSENLSNNDPDEENEDAYEEYLNDHPMILYWEKEEPNHQLVNSKFICSSCYKKEN